MHPSEQNAQVAKVTPVEVSMSPMPTRGDTSPPKAKPMAPSRAEAVPALCRWLSMANAVVEVKVINYGYVIPADELPLIFNKFYRVEHSRSTNTGGTGLGLAIAKNIVEMHGGTIDVTSDTDGTVFSVRLRVNFDVNRENFGKIG